MVNTEEEVLQHKTNQRSTNKKSFFERKIKPKRTVWGIIDVYRFITVETLAAAMNKSIGNLVNIKNSIDFQMICCFFFLFFSEQIQEVLLYFPEIKNIEPTAQIESLHVLKEIAFKCGYKIRIVAPPAKEEKQEIVSKSFM